MAAVDIVIERVLQRVKERIATLTVAEPAFALSVTTAAWTEWLDVQVIAVGLERDKEQWGPGECWNPHDYSFQSYFGWTDLAELDADFACACAEAKVELELGIEEPQRYVYNHVAARLDPALMPFPITEDFVVYAFIQPDIVDTMENLQFSASPQALAILENKGLCVAPERDRARGTKCGEELDGAWQRSAGPLLAQVDGSVRGPPPADGDLTPRDREHGPGH